MREFWQISYLFAPLLLGLTAHGVCIRFGWLRFLYHAVDGGARMGGRPVFGANKTYRGIAAMSLGTGLGFALQALWLHNYESVRWLELFEYTPAKAIIIGYARRPRRRLKRAAEQLYQAAARYRARPGGARPGKFVILHTRSGRFPRRSVDSSRFCDRDHGLESALFVYIFIRYAPGDIFSGLPFGNA